MNKGTAQALISSLIGLAYWSAFSILFSAKEPWDGLYYWSAAYPVSLIISAALGFVFQRRAWITGLSLTFAQFPIIALNTGIGPLSLVAMAFLGVLSVPLIIAASMGSAGPFRQRRTKNHHFPIRNKGI